VHFRPGSICMAPAILSAIAFLALIVWRFALTSQRRRLAVRATGAFRRQENSFLEQGLHILERAAVVMVGGDRFEHASGGSESAVWKDDSKTYLLRIVAITGATKMGGGYALDVGVTRFQVCGSYVRRMQDGNNPKSAYEETCFYTADKSIPKAEQIATVLLQLKNNPALFDRWAAQSGAFKADGQPFSPAD
jgi:hypothetical protein